MIDTIRRAASLMRERADALSTHTANRWHTYTPNKEKNYPQRIISYGNAALIAETYNEPTHPTGPLATADHIASWDPTTAAAVAKLLDDIVGSHDDVADELGQFCAICGQKWPCDSITSAFNVAQTYLRVRVPPHTHGRKNGGHTDTEENS